MSLITCPECGKLISDKAVACPQCGNPIASGPAADVKAPGRAARTPPATWASWIFTGIVFAMAYVLNPTPLMHEARIREAIAAREPIASMFGAGIIAAKAAQYHSLALGSYTTLDGRILTVGACALVVLIQ